MEQVSDVNLTGYQGWTRAKAYLWALLDKLAIDRAVAFGISAKLWQAAASIVTIAVIAIYYTPEMQGYYYTFISLMALQIFAELGLGNVIINFASHEWAHLRLCERNGIVGPESALARLAGLGRFALRWYAAAGAAVFVIMGAVGCFLFTGGPHYAIDWRAPWILFSLLIGIRLWLIPFLALLEGCNQVSSVYFCRLMEVVITSATLWLCIMLDLRLFAPCVSVSAGIAWCVLFLFGKYKRFFRVFFSKHTAAPMSWRSEILPMQWRIALSFLGGYFTFYLFTPLTFRFDGPIAAGRMGMTFAIASGLSAVASMWIYARVPRFGQMIAKKRFDQLDQLFYRVASISVVLIFTGGLCAWATVYWLHIRNSFISARILPLLPTGLLFLAAVLMQVSFCQAAYLRAHKKEPFLTLSIVQGVLTSLSLLMFGRLYGVLGMVAGYLAIVAFFTVPYGAYVWNKCRIEWHKDNKLTQEHVDSE
ncbi:MAG TPA: hypothetical protein VJJ98_11310 [Sedimentisphaerales bacterium]|nr:hypothetical protein [Sedimentisphaerales bacterium]